ncbi:hypothetical protein MUGA111182_08530 [Mucilaginibacter galii]|uniref:Catalase n=1 Tax=Mucilaginibacter galii TaxID=2005073 RepID=A0A917J923_9SPHI|nr:hypothetical protein [Mucilaginibacter galii]GGI49529.1 hypothetical protein GCM10011425_07410 [Mucilaginibacter galii]
MVENFTKADPEYGQRLAEDLKAAAAKKLTGTGTAHANETVHQAEDAAHEAKPY